MKLLGKKLLNDFKEMHADARSDIESWVAEVEDAQWRTPHHLKERYPKASLIKDQHVVFNICWNKYRILVHVNYKNGIVLIKKVDLHKNYDDWKIG
jgi:mRNA interferase HigB